MITLDAHKKEGLKVSWPWIPDANTRYSYINKVKRTGGFVWNASAKAWIAEGPEVILDMDRIDLWQHISTITPEATARVAAFRTNLELILNAKEEEHEGAYGYQKTGTKSLVLQKRGILADDMGLGKSKQALDACAQVDAKNILIVAPKSLTWNWYYEIEKWYPKWQTYAVISDDKRKRQAQWESLDDDRFIAIVNYEKLRLGDWPSDIHWDVIIFDEAHRLKNPQTATYKQAKKLRSEYLWAITGTPMEIRIEELYGIMTLLRPGLFGGWMRFREQHLMMDAWGNVLGPKNLELLKERISPWMTRRRKEDVLTQLPPKIYNNVFVELSPSELKEYNKIKSEFYSWLAENDRNINEANTLTQLLRLQQYTSSPDLLANEDDEVIRGSKYEVLKEVLQDWDGKVMIFSRFAQMILALLEWLQEDFKNDMHPEALIAGGIDGKVRVERVEKFNNDQLGRFLLSTDAGAYGLNVTGANLIIHYDQLWNPGKMWQREDRLHRIGQAQVVNVLTLITEGTVDEGMAKVLDKRREIFKDIVDGAEDVAIQRLGAGNLKKLVEGKL